MAADQFSNDLLALIGNELRRLRGNEKMTTAAEGIGISQTALNQIENGKYDGLHVTLLYAIVAYYRIPLSEFFSAIEKNKYL